MIISKLFVAGLPGSGKTTLLERYQDNDNILTLDLDEIGEWSIGDNPIFVTDLVELRKRMTGFEEVQELNEKEHYMIIIAGYSSNILSVSKVVNSWNYMDMWLMAKESTLIKRLVERADNADEDNWWSQFKGKPEAIQAMEHSIDPETILSDIDKKNILYFKYMAEFIDKQIDEMNETMPDGQEWKPEDDDVGGDDYSLDTKFGFAGVNTMYFISAKRMIVVFDIVQTSTYCYWAVKGGEDHRIITSAKGPFDTSLGMEDNGTTWADNRVTEDYFLDQAGHTAVSIKQLYGKYATAWMKNQNKLFMTKREEE